MNRQTTHAEKVSRLARHLQAKATDDPEGVISVLLTARRLLADGGDLCKDGWREDQSRGKESKYSVMGALREAVDIAHPKDRERAAWAAQHALQGAIEQDTTAENGRAHNGIVITRWESHPKTTFDDAVRVFDTAIKNQGRVNVAQSKAKGRK